MKSTIQSMQRWIFATLVSFILLPIDYSQASICSGQSATNVSRFTKEFLESYKYHVRLRRILPLVNKCDPSINSGCEFNIKIGVGDNQKNAEATTLTYRVNISQSIFGAAFQSSKPIIVNESVMEGRRILNVEWGAASAANIYINVEESDLLMSDKVATDFFRVPRAGIFGPNSVRPNCDDNWYVMTRTVGDSTSMAKFLFTIEARKN
jgi:hypothetical protein